MWVSKIWHDSKLKYIATITNRVTGVRLTIPYDDMSKVSDRGIDRIVQEITDKLNS